MLIDEYGGEVPGLRIARRLPGVGRKTANVVISNAFGVPAIAVDTHVERVSKRLGIAEPDDSVLEVEKKLMRRAARRMDDHASSAHLLRPLSLQGATPEMRGMSAAGSVQGRQIAHEGFGLTAYYPEMRAFDIADR